MKCGAEHLNASLLFRRLIASVEVRPVGTRFTRPEITVRGIISELLRLPATNEPQPAGTVTVAEGTRFSQYSATLSLDILCRRFHPKAQQYQCAERHPPILEPPTAPPLLLLLQCDNYTP